MNKIIANQEIALFKFGFTALVLIVAFSLMSFTGVPCKGKKKDGSPCKSTIVSKASGYCNAHDPSAKKCVFIKKDKTRCKMTVKDGETNCRFHKVN